MAKLYHRTKKYFERNRVRTYVLQMMPMCGCMDHAYNHIGVLSKWGGRRQEIEDTPYGHDHNRATNLVTVPNPRPN
jgi:hypothetical protein